VPACRLPLRTAWTVHDHEKSVLVSCDKTSAPEYGRKWSLAVRIRGESLQENYFIREAAIRFVRKENSKGTVNWIADYPSGAPMLPKCAVPLAAEWREKGVRPSVTVICRHAVDTEWGEKKWRVKVPVF